MKVNNNQIITKMGQVISIFDETDGERIKVRLSPEDDKEIDDDIPYAYPLLPKMIHIKPKVGEMVVVLLTEAGNGHSIRRYIGPIISQPQNMEEDDGGLNALSTYPGARKEPNVAPSTNGDSHGAFAKDEDIAIYGRKKSDIILTNDDVRIRCGSRMRDIGQKGDIVFNTNDPAYLHLKHTDNRRGSENDEYRSTATLVADKINLIGNNSIAGDFKTGDKDNLITDAEMQKIIDKAHELPYGDILVDFLNLFRKAFLNHCHPYPGIEPCPDVNVVELSTYQLDQILSDTVRIN